jgi:hypothetical protein
VGHAKIANSRRAPFSRPRVQSQHTLRRPLPHAPNAVGSQKNAIHFYRLAAQHAIYGGDIHCVHAAANGTSRRQPAMRRSIQNHCAVGVRRRGRLTGAADRATAGDSIPTFSDIPRRLPANDQSGNAAA